jgi:hypothetical protein
VMAAVVAVDVYLLYRFFSRNGSARARLSAPAVN